MKSLKDMENSINIRSHEVNTARHIVRLWDDYMDRADNFVQDHYAHKHLTIAEDNLIKAEKLLAEAKAELAVYVK